MSPVTDWISRVFGRLLGSIMRHAQESVWREPAGPLRAELQRRATQAAADFVTERMPLALFCANKFDHLDYALSLAPPGLALEFGVLKGTTINHLARLRRERSFYGFDNFRGLPEQWAGVRFSRRNFDRKGRKPKVEANVTLIEGWFADSLPRFLASNREPIGFVHIDCDLYSSAKTVLDHCAARLAPHAVIVFDEFFNYKGYELHEYRAFAEFAERFDVQYSFLAYSGQQVSLCVEAVRRVDQHQP